MPQSWTPNFFEQTRVGAETTIGENRPARALLQANCAHCHSANAGGAVSIFLNQELLTAQMNIVDVPPLQGGLGLHQPKIVDAGDPWNSVLAVRMAKLHSGHMPLIGAHEIDVEGLKVIEDWIARMPGETDAPKPWTATAWDQSTIERELSTVSGAMRVRRAIDDGRLDGTLRASAFKVAWASSEPTVRDIFERFKPDELRERTLEPRSIPRHCSASRATPRTARNWSPARANSPRARRVISCKDKAAISAPTFHVSARNRRQHRSSTAFSPHPK